MTYAIVEFPIERRREPVRDDAEDRWARLAALNAASVERAEVVDRFVDAHGAERCEAGTG